jgi:phosphoesterase RecJ-like protein
MKQDNFQTAPVAFKDALLTSIQAARSIALTTHINPDGDGLCACLALKRILLQMGYMATLIVDDLSLDRFDFLAARQDVSLPDEQSDYDLLIIVDLHDRGRLGNRACLADHANETYIIDHHEIENDLMNVSKSWVEPWAVCTGWMIYRLFEREISALNPADQLYVGNCLYVTLLNDTNNFTNANTDIHTYEFSTALCQLGIKPHQLYRKFMTSRTADEMRLIGSVLSTIETHDHGNILFMHSTLQMLIDNHLDSDATSNLTRWVTDLKGVDTIVYFREEAENEYRLSLRSKSLNVHAIALTYGGGGHLVAAGCHCQGTLAELKYALLNQIRSASKVSFST